MDIVEEKKENTLIIVITHYTGITISAEEDYMKKNINISILSFSIYDQMFQIL
jgi:hypothetical protein